MLAPAAVGVVVGLGAYGYELALRGLTRKLAPACLIRARAVCRRSSTASRPPISTGCSSRACRTSDISRVFRARARCCSSAAATSCSSPTSAIRRRSATKSAISRASRSRRRACGRDCGSSLARCRTSRSLGFESGASAAPRLSASARGGRALAVAADDGSGRGAARAKGSPASSRSSRRRTASRRARSSGRSRRSASA